MRQSALFAPVLREEPAAAETASHRLLQRAGFIRPLAAGVFTYLPLGLRVLHKLEQIIREEMEAIGAQQVLLPALQPAELWRETGRYDVYGPELIRLHDRSGREFALGPTHEEVVTALIRDEVRSYRQLPVTLYQIQTKFRDERRPRSGLLRGREFLMKDAYSFDATREGLQASYARMYEAYGRLFARCGLRVRAVEADAGAIGGDGRTHEFIAEADIGEDTIVSCPSCGYAANTEVAGAVDRCPACEDGELRLTKGIEVGHLFMLGTVYSDKLKAAFAGVGGREERVLMGCYGIGVSRMMAAIVEQRLTWPMAVAPFHVHIIPVAVRDDIQMRTAEALYRTFTSRGIEALIDDREERFGVKLNDADLFGIPVQLLVGKQAGDGRVEYTAFGDARRQVLSCDEAVRRVDALVNGDRTVAASGDSSI